MTVDPQTDYPIWIETGNVPPRSKFGEKFIEELSSWYDERSKARREFVREFGFALPCHEAIQEISKLSPIIEVGSGTGAWAAILAANGTDIVASDVNVKSGYLQTIGKYYPVETLDASAAINKYPNRNILMIWPCYDLEWAELAVIHILPEKYLILISEGKGGCCGNDGLFQFLERKFEHVKLVRLPSWWGLHDKLDIYRRLND